MPNSLEGKIAVVWSEPAGADRRNRRQSPGKQGSHASGVRLGELDTDFICCPKAGR